MGRATIHQIRFPRNLSRLALNGAKPNKMETNGKVLMFVHVLHGNNEDLFICESNAIKTQYTCLDTEQNTCHFERYPNETREIVLPYSGEGCVCVILYSWLISL